MASIIRIKRSSVSGNPTTLAAGELAYSNLTDNGSNGGDRLYIGMGTETNGNAANHVVIGGKYFTDLLDHAPGTLTATSAILVDSNKKIDELNVDNITINGNTVSSTNTNGDISITPNGTGKTIIGNIYTDPSTSLLEYIQDATGGQVVAGEGIDVSYDDAAGTVTVSGEDATDTNKGIASFNATDFTVTSGSVTLNAERVQDIVGDMVSSNTESGISVTYDDVNGKLDFNVNDPVITISGDADGSATMTNLGNTTISITLDTVNSNVGSFGSTTKIPTFTVNGKGLVTAAGEVDVATNLSIAGDTGTDTVSLLSDTLTVAGGEGIDVAVTNNTITVSGEDASTSNKGVASFNSSDFSVSSGAVSISNVNLGSQTTGNYVATIAGTTNQISVSGSGSETAAVTLSLPQNIHTGATPTFAGMSLSGNLAMGSNKITGLADPVDAQDAATKAYVDAARSGLDVKQSVRAATTANITLSGTQTVDGVALSVGDRVLVKNQTNAVQNGIYVVASGSWSRASDADQPNEVSPGLFLFVEEGSTNADNGYVITSDAPLTVGSDAIVFTQFSGAGMIVAGNALSKTGNTLDVNVAASGGIEIVSDALQLKSTVAGDGLTYSSGVLSVGGTADKITVTADAITIASTYVGQSSITTLGTISTGTWQGNVIDNAYIADDLTISGGTINNTPIGASTRSSGAFTTLNANSTLNVSGASTLASLSATSGTFSSTLGVTGNLTLSANLTGSGSSILSGFDIDGGTYA